MFLARLVLRDPNNSSQLASQVCNPNLLEVIELANANHQYTPDTRARGLAGFAESCEELLRWRATDEDG